MRPEKLYLTDIVEAAQSIARFLQGVSFDEFTQNEMMSSAVLQKLMVIGEAALVCQKNLPKAFRKFHGGYYCLSQHCSP
ncbi:MAG: HepT-like ribonuclease domain-containing protein [Anaerolineales bacterium]